MAINMTFTDFVTPVPADWLNNVNTVVNNPSTSTNVTYTAPGSGTNRNVGVKLAENVSALDWGAVGNGVADDTTPIQNALNYLSSTYGGGILQLGRNQYLIGNITVPQNCTIQGDTPTPGLVNTSVSFYTVPSLLIQKTGTQITMSKGTTARWFTTIRQGLTLPVTTDAQATTVISQFSDTSFFGVDSDITYDNIMLLGHVTGINNSSSIVPPQHNGRSNYIRVTGDCYTLISCQSQFDIPRAFFCHAWPYLTVDANTPSQPAATSLERNGSAYLVQTVDDWAQFVGCFEYGHKTGFDLQSASNINLIGCQCDGPDGTFKLNAFSITGTSSYIHLADCMVNSCQNAITINSTGTWPEVRSSNGNYNCTVNAINVVVGGIKSVNDTIHAAAQGYAFAVGTTASSVISPHFYLPNIPTPWNFATSGLPVQIIAPTYAGGTPAGAFQLSNISSSWLPTTDNTYSNGNATFRWTAVYAVNGTIQTSDRTRKNSIEEVPVQLLQAVAKLPVRKFKHNGQEKWSIGYMAQDLEELLIDSGLPSEEYSMIIKDLLEDGTETYGLNYNQILVLKQEATDRGIK